MIVGTKRVSYNPFPKEAPINSPVECWVKGLSKRLGCLCIDISLGQDGHVQATIIVQLGH